MSFISTETTLGLAQTPLVSLKGEQEIHFCLVIFGSNLNILCVTLKHIAMK